MLVHPGGFRDEFFQLRLGAPAGLLTLGIMLLTRVLQGTAGELAAQLAMILLVPYALTGLAVIHYLVRQAGRSSGWLAAVYIILAFVPQAMLLLAKPEYAKKARYGYVRGGEPVHYVRSIRDRYLAYVQAI